MSTAFAPRSSMAASAGPSGLPTTPRGAYTSTGTPRSARRLLNPSTPSSRASFAHQQPSASQQGQPPVLAPLAPINSRAYPDRPYADDDELRLVMDADRDAVDTACHLLGASLAHQRKAVLEALEEMGAEKRRLDKMTRELGDAAKDMVRTVQREKDELDRARELEGDVTARGRALAVQVETVQAEVKEVLAKLAARRDRASPLSPSSLSYSLACSRTTPLSQSRTSSAKPSRSRCRATAPSSPSSSTSSASRSAVALVRPLSCSRPVRPRLGSCTDESSAPRSQPTSSSSSSSTSIQRRTRAPSRST